MGYLALVVVVVGAMLGLSASAGAATTYRFADTFGAGPGELNGPVGIAVHDATGQIFVIDGDHVNVYESSGGLTPSLITTISGFSAPQSVAIDQASGAIYIADAGASQIQRYTSDGAPVPTFTRDLAYIGPAAGSGPSDVGSFASPIAVDPRNGDLVIADTGNLRVSRFSNAGAFIVAFDGSGTQAGAFVRPLSVAVDDVGDVYVVDNTVGSFPFTGSTTVVEQFDATGGSRGVISEVDPAAAAVTFDPATGNLVVVGRAELTFSPSAPPLRMYVLDDGTLVEILDLPSGTGQSAVAGLVIDGGTSGRLYALTRAQFGFGTTGVQMFDPIVLPDLTIGTVSDVTTTAATFHGTVDPLGVPSTTAYFEYSVDGQSWSRTPDIAVAAAGPVEFRATTLTPNREYRVRLVGVNGNGELRSQAVSFTTPAAPPAVQARKATDRTTDGATLRGTVNPFGLQTTYHFEYGTTEAYGQRAPAHESVAGNGYSPRHVAQGITGLTPGTTYHFRLVARSSAGTTTGPDQTFTTRAPASTWQFERVSPAEKGGSNVNPRLTFRTSADGGRIYYRWRTAPNGAPSAPRFASSLATRDGASWTSRPVDPPQLSRPAIDDPYLSFVLGTSEDLTRAIVVSRQALADGAVEGFGNIYRYDIESGEYTHLATAPEESVEGANVGQSQLVGGSSDFSRVLLGGVPYELVPGAPMNALYEWSGGELRVASVAPDGTSVMDFVASAGQRGSKRDRRWMSEDGTRVFFSGIPGFNPAYVRLDGRSTIVMSKSERIGDGGAEKPATFVGAPAHGRWAYILSRDLTDDSPSDSPSLYRFDVETEDLTFLTALGASGSGDLPDDVLQVARDGSSVAFVSGLALTPEAVGGSSNLYMWRADSVELVATLGPNDTGGRPQELMVSRNGRFVGFTAYSALTGVDNAATTVCNDLGIDTPGVDACRQVFRYDSQTDELVCASCRPDSGSPTGNAFIGAQLALQEGEQHLPDVMLDDGRLVFDTTDPLTSNDRNGGRDVYVFDEDPVLVSRGDGSGASEIADVSADGSTIFFTTEDQLVGSDTDTLTDLYAARRDGGLPSQNPAQEQPACVREDCRGGGSGPRGSTPLPSQVTSSAIRRGTKPAKATVRIARAAFDGTWLRLTVSVSGSGRIRVTGSKVGTLTKTATKAGTYDLKVRLRSRYRAQRRSGRRVRTQVSVKFTPAFGKSVSVKSTRTAAR